MLQVRHVVSGLHGRDRGLDSVADDPGLTEAGGGHALGDTVLHDGQERLPEAVEIQKDDRLGMQVQPLP
jgi:hypothetical protein